jgi:hypothetical protein
MANHARRARTNRRLGSPGACISEGVVLEADLNVSPIGLDNVDVQRESVAGVQAWTGVDIRWLDII